MGKNTVLVHYKDQMSKHIGTKRYLVHALDIWILSYKILMKEMSCQIYVYMHVLLLIIWFSY